MPDNYLPGSPRKALVKRVRRGLWSWGIRPQERTWRATWEWAAKVAHSYIFTAWPLPSEIQTQYVFLLLAEMRSLRQLKLPHRAFQRIPEAVAKIMAEAMPAATPPALPLQLIDGEGAG